MRVTPSVVMRGQLSVYTSSGILTDFTNPRVATRSDGFVNLRVTKASHGISNPGGAMLYIAKSSEVSAPYLALDAEIY